MSRVYLNPDERKPLLSSNSSDEVSSGENSNDADVESDGGIVEGKKLTRDSAATAIQAAWRGYIRKKRLEDASKGKLPDKAGANDEAIQKAYMNPDYEGTQEAYNGIMDRVTLKQELAKIGCKPDEKDCAVTSRDSNRLLYLTGQIKNNGLKNGYPNDSIYMDEDGNVSFKYDLTRAWAETDYRRSLLNMGEYDPKSAADHGTFALVKFENGRKIDLSYRTGGNTGQVDETPRQSEIIYINDSGVAIRHIGNDLINQLEKKQKESNKLSELEEVWLDNVIKYGASASNLIRQDYADASKYSSQDFLNNLIKDTAREVPDFIKELIGLTPDATREDFDTKYTQASGKDPQLENKILKRIESELEIIGTLELSTANLDKINELLDPETIREAQLENLKNEIFSLDENGKNSHLLPFVGKLMGLDEKANPQQIKAKYNELQAQGTKESKEVLKKIDLELKLAAGTLEIKQEDLKEKTSEVRYQLLENAQYKPLTAGQKLNIIEKNPSLKEKLQLETKLNSRNGFRDQESRLKDSKGQDLTGDERYTQLKNINRHVNRESSQEFIKTHFHKQEQSLASQKDALNAFRDAMISKTKTGSLSKDMFFEDITKDPPTFPITNHGVAQSLNYTGAAKASLQTTKIAKISFNKSKPEGDEIDPELNEQFINIPGTDCYKRVVRIPAKDDIKNQNAELKLYKDGKAIPVKPKEEEQIIIDENTVWRNVSVLIEKSPPKYATRPTPYKVFTSLGYPSDDLKRDLMPSMLGFVTKGYKDLGIEAISMENGIIKAMAAQTAGVRSKSATTSLTQSDVAKNMLAIDEQKIKELRHSSKSSTTYSAPMENTILNHQENLNRISKMGMSTTGHVNRLIKDNTNTLDNLETIHDPFGAEQRFKDQSTIFKQYLEPILRNETLNKLDNYVTNSNKKPSVQEFRRQVARYAVQAANKDLFASSRESLLSEIFKSANDALTTAGYKEGVDGFKRDEFNKSLEEEMKSYAKAKGDKAWSKYTTGFHKIADDRVTSGKNKGITQDFKDSTKLQENAIEAYTEYEKKPDKNVDSTEDKNSFKEAIKKIDPKSNALENIVKGITKEELPKTPWGLKSEQGAVNILGAIFDTKFSKKMSEFYTNGTDRPDVKRFSAQLAAYAVEAAQHDLLASSRKSFLEGVIELANDKLTQKGITVNRDKFTAQLTSDMKDYAKNRSSEAWNNITMRKTGYQAIGKKEEGRVDQAAERFKSEERGYKSELAKLENDCIEQLKEHNAKPLEGNAFDKLLQNIKDLPVTSLARVREGYENTMAREGFEEQSTTIKQPKHQTSDLKSVFDSLRDQVFVDKRNFDEKPLQPSISPIDLLQTRQFEYEAGKWIAETAKEKFGRQTDHHRGWNRVGYDLKGRESFINNAIDEANAMITGYTDPKHHVISEIKQNVSLHAADKLEEASKKWTPEPLSQSKTKYGKIAKQTNDESLDEPKTTKGKWVEKINNKPAEREDSGIVTY